MKCFGFTQIKLTFESDALDAIVSKVMENKNGATDLQYIVESQIAEPTIESSDNDVISICITKECVQDNKKPQFVRRNQNDDEFGPKPKRMLNSI